MNWEDTVISDEQVNHEVCLAKEAVELIRFNQVEMNTYLRITNAQAELTWDIAFKAGYDKRESEFVYNPDYLDFQKGVKTGKELGIKEVVEWINSGNIIHDINWAGGRKEWQAKLKAWGIK